MYGLSIGTGLEAVQYRIRKTAGHGQDLDHGQRDLIESDRFHPRRHLTKFGKHKFNSRRMVGQPWPDKIPYADARSRYSNHS